jgi:hypothetical protein
VWGNLSTMSSTSASTLLQAAVMPPLSKTTSWGTGAATAGAALVLGALAAARVLRPPLPTLPAGVAGTGTAGSGAATAGCTAEGMPDSDTMAHISLSLLAARCVRMAASGWDRVACRQQK